MESSMDIDDKDMVKEGEKKVGTKLCSRGIASAKAKYDVYPSAYSSGHAVQVCKGKIKGLGSDEKNDIDAIELQAANFGGKYENDLKNMKANI